MNETHAMGVRIQADANPRDGWTHVGKNQILADWQVYFNALNTQTQSAAEITDRLDVKS